MTIGERMKRRLLGIVDHPLVSVTALDARSEELFPLGASGVAGSADDSFNPKFLLVLTHSSVLDLPPQHLQ